ncbi:VOC family protein [Nocardioides daejeonensis]|uniref:VOC family protein n=1 Tax=Nocardioides daejeonensis TaxID=1046556 RepID=UPI000D74BBB2|nr:VOC family protein [Nocardioides daejeonensis]
MRLHHVQVSCPPGGEEIARRFWVDGMGLVEVTKPAALASRGGVWFRASDGAEIHVGVEADFRPATKAHPALVVDDRATLAAIADRLESLGFSPDQRERRTFEGHLRFHVADGHGNRVEVLAPAG